MTLYEVRRYNLKRILGEQPVAQFARKHALSQRYIRRLVGEQARMGECFARKIERIVGLQAGWLDVSPFWQISNDAFLIAVRWESLDRASRDFICAMIAMREHQSLV